jgi:hypothetical protein
MQNILLNSVLKYGFIFLIRTYKPTHMHPLAADCACARIIMHLRFFKHIFKTYFHSCLVSNGGCQAGQQNLLKYDQKLNPIITS